MASTDLDQRSVDTLRILSLDQVQAAGIGHIGLPLGAAPIAEVLFRRFLVADPAEPGWVNRDRFVLSAGHGSALLYSVLHLAGYQLSLDDLRAFRQWGSITPGHPEAGVTPGVDATTGPLGQGIANAVGMAIAESIAAARLNTRQHPVIDHRTFALVSDGDLMEGVALEAMALAGRLRLGKLVAYYDDNDIVIDGRASAVHDADAVCAALAAYGWHVSAPVDGNDLAGLEAATHAALAETERPSLIRVKTTIGFGSTLADTPKIHSGAVSVEETAAIRRALGWEVDEAFHVPQEVREHWRGFAERGLAARVAWEERVAGLAAEAPERAAALDRWQQPIDPALVEAALAGLQPPAGPEAVRVSAGRVLAALAETVDQLVGGAADLASATMAVLPQGGHYSAEDRAGRNIAFGIREHAMGAIANGIALHGLLRPFASTFMVFASYQANAMRMAALQHLPVIQVLSHDTIAVGEDGPTHQPVEMLATFRATPNTLVLRPADAAEAAECWALALANTTGPSLLILSRTPVPQLDRGARQGSSAQGGYVLRPAEGAPALVLAGSGSEVQFALAAADALAAEGVAVQVVSLPSLELFERQSQEYRDSVLPPGVPRVIVEASHPQSFRHLAGDTGLAYGVTRFGASAPPAVMLEQYGFTATAVAEAARGLLAARSAV